MPSINTKRRIPGEKRRQSIMKTAWKLFAKKGYAAVTLDEIISKAGGSKSSIYEFFGGKEGLFFAIHEEATANIIKNMALPETEGMPIREALKHIGFALGRNILSDKAIELYRLSVSVSKKFPKIAKYFYEYGPLTAQKVLADFLRKQTRAGRLKIDDHKRAAEIFFATVLEYKHMEMSLNYTGIPSDRELKRIIDEAVDVFYKAYGID
jgi:AcrR family transcriptional regulator